jgi:hypothetical protein
MSLTIKWLGGAVPMQQGSQSGPDDMAAADLFARALSACAVDPLL